MSEKQANERVKTAQIVCKPTQGAAKAHAMASAQPDPSGAEPAASILARNTIQAGSAPAADEVEIG